MHSWQCLLSTHTCIDRIASFHNIHGIGIKFRQIWGPLLVPILGTKNSPNFGAFGGQFQHFFWPFWCHFWFQFWEPKMAPILAHFGAKILPFSANFGNGRPRIFSHFFRKIWTHFSRIFVAFFPEISRFFFLFFHKFWGHFWFPKWEPKMAPILVPFGGQIPIFGWKIGVIFGSHFGNQK